MFAQAIKDISKETFTQCRRSEIKFVSGSLAYTSVLSIIPLIAVVIFCLQLFGYLDLWYQQIQPLLLQNLAPGASQNLNTYLLTFINKTRKASVGLIGIGSLLITAYITFNQFHWAINKIMAAPEQEKFHRKIIKVVLFIFFVPLLVAASLSLTAFLKFKGFLGAVLLNTLVFFITYRIIPNVKLKNRSIAKGAMILGITWELIKVGYSIYSKRALNYNKFYGSFSAFPLFLIWTYVAWYVVLAGAALTKAIHNYDTKKKGSVS